MQLQNSIFPCSSFPLDFCNKQKSKEWDSSPPLPSHFNKSAKTLCWWIQIMHGWQFCLLIPINSTMRVYLHISSSFSMEMCCFKFITIIYIVHTFHYNFKYCLKIEKGKEIYIMHHRFKLDTVPFIIVSLSGTMWKWTGRVVLYE